MHGLNYRLDRLYLAQRLRPRRLWSALLRPWLGLLLCPYALRLLFLPFRGIERWWLG